MIIIHSAVNFTGYLMKYFSDLDSSSINETLVESYGGILNLTLAIVVSVLLVCACIYYLNKKFEKKEKLNDNQ